MPDEIIDVEPDTADLAPTSDTPAEVPTDSPVHDEATADRFSDPGL